MEYPHVLLQGLAVGIGIILLSACASSPKPQVDTPHQSKTEVTPSNPPTSRSSPWQCRALGVGDWRCQKGAGEDWHYTLDEIKASNHDEDEGKDGNWLKQAQPGQYTVQLIAAADPANIKRLLRKYPDLNRGAVIHVDRTGKALQLMVWGLYSSKAEAQKAVKQPPISKVKEVRPWVRTVESILSPH